MVTAEEVEAFLANNYELRALEVKGSSLVRGQDRFVAKVARAVMAMGNLRDGGLVVIGIGNSEIAAMQPGLDDAQFAEWSDFDLVNKVLGPYSDPPVSFEVVPLELCSGALVVVLEVAEFDVDIHVCRKDFQGVTQDGQTYVRGRGEPRSVPVPSSAEARELHDLAIDKGLRNFLRRAGAAGLPLSPAPSAEELDRVAYKQEYSTAWAAPNPVNSPPQDALGAWAPNPGFFDVAIRPSVYAEDRVPAVSLKQFVVENVVRLSGWPVPFVDDRRETQHHDGWVGQDIGPSGMPHGEAWRIFTSGQFLHRRVLSSDLADATSRQPTMNRGPSVSVHETLMYLVQVAELGARMATALGLDAVTFDIALAGIAGRELVSGTSDRELNGYYTASSDRLESKASVDVAKLLEDPRSFGVQLAQSLLHKFGLNVPDQVLFEWQAKVLRT